MKTRMSGLSATICTFVLALGLFGCAASGPKFQEAASPASGQALIYIYRPGKFMGGGVAFDVHEGKKEADHAITTLQSGGYFPYYAPPGEVTLWAKTESSASVTLDVKADKTYYVRGSVGVGLIVGRPSLEVVDAAKGAAEVKDCKLLPPAK
jgi:hypothetical protein